MKLFIPILFLLFLIHPPAYSASLDDFVTDGTIVIVDTPTKFSITSISGSTSANVGETKTYSAVPSGNQGSVTYKWAVNQDVLSSTNDRISVTFDSAGSNLISVVGADSAGNQADARTYVNVTQAVVATVSSDFNATTNGGFVSLSYSDFVLTPTLEENTSVTFTASTFNSNYNYQWLAQNTTTNSKITTLNATSFDYNFPEGAGTYKITLKISGNDIETSTTEKYIAIKQGTLTRSETPVYALEPASDEQSINFYRDEATGDVWGNSPAWQLDSPTNKLPEQMWQYGLRSIYLAKYACLDESVRSWMPNNIASGIWYCTNPDNSEQVANTLKNLAQRLQDDDRNIRANTLPVEKVSPAAGEIEIDYYRNEETGDVWGDVPAWQLPAQTGNIPEQMWQYGLRSIYLAKYACWDSSVREWMPTNIASGILYCTNPEDRQAISNLLLDIADKIENPTSEDNTNDTDTTNPDSENTDTDTTNPDSENTDTDTTNPDSENTDTDTTNPDSENTDTDTTNPDSENTDTDTSTSNIPNLINYSFSATASKTIVGTSTESANEFNCNQPIQDSEVIGHLTLVSLFYENACYTDGRYNDSNYLVEQGVLSSAETQFEAYKINAPTIKATEFLASKHALYYQFPTQEDYTIYTFNNNNFSKVTDVPASSINTSQFTPLSITANTDQDAVIYVFVPSNQTVSVFTQFTNQVEAAQINTNSIANVLKYRYTTTGLPFDTATGFNEGPNSWKNRYSFTRQFFLVQHSNAQLGTVWQDKDNNNIYLTWFGSDLLSPQTLTLINQRNEILAAATGDNAGNIYYLTIQSGDGKDTEIARTATLYKANEAGELITSKIQDTSANQLNMVTFGTNNVASLTYVNAKLGLILGRQKHQSSDGLNHQGAIAVVFDANSLEIDANWGQTSGHSFESFLTVNNQAEFVGIDLGDNYPRGINLHKFTASDYPKSRVVYTFKTLHGTEATSPAGVTYPFYADISGQTNYYQWSNDNNTYTELGGLIEGQNSYTVVFAGENTTDGRALDNSRVGENLNDSRNIGLVQVIKDYENASGGGNVVSDDLVLTQGITEEGGFYTFGGDWSEQRNAGVVWLTNYTNAEQENVSRLKTVKLSDGNILLLWEKWTADSYVNTYAMKISESGIKLSSVIELGNLVRLNRRDDPYVYANNVYLVAGHKLEQRLELIVLQMK